ncbi:unsaturated glucuronyl hydrolase [Thozetella sp. PMI_491]|nr:unsaturated glucuronyl hydrolase [Thozetella sp. PMI_491]
MPTRSAAESDVTSWSDEAPRDEHPVKQPGTFHNEALVACLGQLFSDNIAAKLCRTGTLSLEEDKTPGGPGWRPVAYPEIVLQSGPSAGLYEFREPDFWTCGFFPGTLYALLERSIRYPQAIRIKQTDTSSTETPISPHVFRKHLQHLCRIWANPLHAMANRTDTHDIGFIIMPALRRSWELTGDPQSLASIVTAANSLATRYVSSAGAIRSWDLLLKKDINVTDMTQNLLVIIDSMCNLDLLFYAAAHSGVTHLADIAEAHARTLLRTHLRPEFTKDRQGSAGYTGQLYSTCHVANLDPATGELLWRRSAQGYSAESTWARGQSWAILGYAQTYMWTKNTVFLEVACGVAEYFLLRLETSPLCVEVPVDGPEGQAKGRNVPLWDFDAPIENPSKPLRDSSAGVIAANGMLILSQALAGRGEHSLSRWFLESAIRIVSDTIALCSAEETACFALVGENDELRVEDVRVGQTYQGLLKNGTANNNEFARRRYANHGLVYGDYYLVQFGNQLLEMGLV